MQKLIEHFDVPSGFGGQLNSLGLDISEEGVSGFYLLRYLCMEAGVCMEGGEFNESTIDRCFVKVEQGLIVKCSETGKWYRLNITAEEIEVQEAKKEETKTDIMLRLAKEKGIPVKMIKDAPLDPWVDFIGEVGPPKEKNDE